MGGPGEGGGEGVTVFAAECGRLKLLFMVIPSEKGLRMNWLAGIRGCTRRERQAVASGKYRGVLLSEAAEEKRSLLYYRKGKRIWKIRELIMGIPFPGLCQEPCRE